MPRERAAPPPTAPTGGRDDGEGTRGLLPSRCEERGHRDGFCSSPSPPLRAVLEGPGEGGCHRRGAPGLAPGSRPEAAPHLPALVVGNLGGSSHLGERTQHLGGPCGLGAGTERAELGPAVLLCRDTGRLVTPEEAFAFTLM